jgi:hypothetical protein
MTAAQTAPVVDNPVVAMSAARVQHGQRFRLSADAPYRMALTPRLIDGRVVMNTLHETTGERETGISLDAAAVVEIQVWAYSLSCSSMGSHWNAGGYYTAQDAVDAIAPLRRSQPDNRRYEVRACLRPGLCGVDGPIVYSEA